MARRRARLARLIVFLSAVLPAAGCGVDPVPLPPEPRGFAPPRPVVPPSLVPEKVQRAELLRRLDQRTGPAARDCGTFELRRRDPEPDGRSARLLRALACLQSESVRRHPARLIIRQQAIDTWVVRGLLTKADGAIWAFDYVADPTGDRLPQLRSRPCPVPVAAPQVERAEFGCEGITERP